MPCQTCRQNILDGTQSWGLHPPEYYTNPNIDVKKCTFCSQLRRDVQRTQSLNKGPTQPYPTYRWTIRTCPAIRETRSNQYTTITFRPVQAAQAETSPATTSTLGALPTRTFYIFDPCTLSIPRCLSKSTDTSAVDGSAPQIRKWISTCLFTHERCSGSLPVSSTFPPTSSQTSSITIPPGSPFVPTRLLDISQDPVYVLHTPSHPLVFPPGTGGQNLPAYATLSHCWGTHPMLMLTSSTYAEFTNPSVGIADAKLPRTFRQAIQVARETLGVKYIWIDSLCIIQKDWVTGDKGDFETEGQLMHKVYRFSFCNIAAVDSGDSTGGLFRGQGWEVKTETGNGTGTNGDYEIKKSEKKERHEILPELVHVGGIAEPRAAGFRTSSNHDGKKGEDDKKKYAILSDVWTSELLSGLLYARGWVFQERMLAPRILHFSATQLFYDCATTSACEILPQGLPASLDGVSSTERHWREMLLATRPHHEQSSSSSAPSRPPLERHLTGTADPSLETLWRESVRQYTSCNLTNYGSDRLAAIWGVAKIVRDRLRVDDPGEEYAAGLWRRRLDQQLAWRVVDHARAERLPELSGQHPSWSWASLRGEIVVASRWVVRTSEGGYRVSGWVRPKGDGLNGGENVGRERVEEDHQVEYTTDGKGNGDDNFEPGLKKKELQIRGLVFEAKWKVVVGIGGSKRGGQWTVEVARTNKVLGGMTKLDVYPDICPTGAGDTCFLVILGLGKSISARRTDEELEDGTGLILELVSGGGAVGGYKKYRRLGTFRTWAVVRGEFDKSLERGAENFYLV